MAGQCPPAHLLVAECEDNYDGNCAYDNDCYTAHKCCETACGYKQCLRLHQPEEPTVVSICHCIGLMSMYLILIIN